MWRQLLTFILFLGILRATNDVSPQSEMAEETYLYLPLMQKLPPHVEVVVTARGELIGYPTYYYVYGYVHSLVPDPLYSVILEVEVTIYPYCEPPDEPCDPYTEMARISPALTATLPDQVNPFSYSLLLGKASASIGDVRAVAASRTEPGGEIYYPITVVSWEHTDGTLLGNIRNDSDQSIHIMRLVVAELKKCSWREAELDDTTLKPNRRTSFQLNFSDTCLGDNLVIVGQGAAPP